MRLGRYKDRDWEAAYRSSGDRLYDMLGSDLPRALVEAEARTLLTCAYRGPWRAAWFLVKAQVASTWRHYVWFRWNWIRVNVFRRPQDEAIAMAERAREEDEQVEALSRQL